MNADAGDIAKVIDDVADLSGNDDEDIHPNGAGRLDHDGFSLEDDDDEVSDLGIDELDTSNGGPPGSEPATADVNSLSTILMDKRQKLGTTEWTPAEDPVTAPQPQQTGVDDAGDELEMGKRKLSDDDMPPPRPAYRPAYRPMAHRPYREATNTALLDRVQKSVRANQYMRMRDYYQKNNQPVPVKADDPPSVVEAEYLAMQAAVMETRRVNEYKHALTSASGLLETIVMGVVTHFKLTNTVNIKGLSANYKNLLESNPDVLLAVFERYGDTLKLDPLVTCAVLLWETMKETNTINQEKRIQQENDVARFQAQQQPRSSVPTGAVTAVRPVVQPPPQPQPQSSKYDSALTNLQAQLANLKIGPTAAKPTPPAAAAFSSPAPPTTPAAVKTTDADGKRTIVFSSPGGM